MKHVVRAGCGPSYCRSPHGERVLKRLQQAQDFIASCRSPHGERVLKHVVRAGCGPSYCRSPHGERVLKRLQQAQDFIASCRSPHGERVLKLGRWRSPACMWGSLPARGACVETLLGVSLLSFCRSLPARGACVETEQKKAQRVANQVAPRTGSVC